MALIHQEMILHALYENGQLAPADIEAHIKDEVEKESVKLTDMDKKMRQAYKDIATAPVIEDDQMFADNGEMLLEYVTIIHPFGRTLNI